MFAIGPVTFVVCGVVITMKPSGTKDGILDIPMEDPPWYSAIGATVASVYSVLALPYVVKDSSKDINPPRKT